MENKTNKTEKVKEFFSKSGWVICMLLAAVLATVILANIFGVKSILYVIGAVVAICIGAWLVKNPRYFISFMLILIAIGVAITIILVIRNGKLIKDIKPGTEVVVIDQTTEKEPDKKVEPTEEKATEQPKSDSTAKKPAAPKVGTKPAAPSTTTPTTSTTPTNPPADPSNPTNPPSTPTPTIPPATISVKFAWADYTPGSTDIFASVMLSEAPKTDPIITSNLEIKVQKINDKLYYVRLSIPEGQKGTAAIEVSGEGIIKVEKTLAY